VGGERVVGAVLFRAGRLEHARERIEQSHKVVLARVWDWIFLAMIKSGLGQAREARRLLEQADQWVAGADKASSGTEGEAPHWSNLTERPITLLLRREAEALIRFDRDFPADPFAPFGPDLPADVFARP
jgi:hypothetical protein